MKSRTLFNKKFRSFSLMTLAYLLIMACGLGSPLGTPDPNSPNAVHTSAAQTIVAQLTQVGSLATPTPTLISTQPTNTLSPSSTPFPTFTPVTPLLTWTPLPINTFVPTAIPIPCNLAQFVSDVTIADGTLLAPNASFTKTWRLKNIGSCAWTTEYDVLFVNGDKMNGPSLVDLPKKVNPGETVDISVQLTAPENPGTYLGNWQLRTASGQTFGIGANGTASFWVKIVVARVVTSEEAYNFVTEACKGAWSSGAGTLSCPGQTSDGKGFMQILPLPVLETGKTDNEPALWVHPQYVTDGFIQVEYPDITINPDYKFVSAVGCLYNYPNCKVIFTLSYRDENGVIKKLGTWQEAYEGLIVPISIDLKDLVGKKVNFILRVDAWGNADADHAFWLNPHLDGATHIDPVPLCPGCEN